MPRKSNSKLDKKQLKILADNIKIFKQSNILFNKEQSQNLNYLENSVKSVKHQDELENLIHLYNRFKDGISIGLYRKTNKFDRRQLQLLYRDIHAFKHMRRLWNDSQEKMIHKLKTMADNVKSQKDLDKLQDLYEEVYVELNGVEPKNYNRDLVEEFKKIALRPDGNEINQIMKNVFHFDISQEYLKRVEKVLKENNKDLMVDILEHYSDRRFM
jgi:hypothetical protein